jgi:iron(III) transport system permease protein
MLASIRFSRLCVFATLVALAFAMPLLVIIASLFQPDGGAWAHIRATTLPALVTDSLLLTLSVAIGVGIIGTITAWVTARFDFVARRQLEWLLVLPLAMPAYVMAYAYTDLLQYAGPVQTALREFFDWQSKTDYWFFEIRSLGGAAIILSFALYPYVYLLARVAFLEQSASLQEVGRTFGYGRAQLFWRVTLPLARPAIVAGIALAMMETLADYGTVSYFGVNTFTTGIFSAWFAQADRVAAAKLASMLLIFVAVVLTVENWARRRQKFTEMRGKQAARLQLKGSRSWLAMLICIAPVVGGFLLPLALIGKLAFQDTDALVAFTRFGDFAVLAWNSFSLASVTAMLAVMVSLLLAYAKRSNSAWPIRAANRAVGLGYAVPGTVIAVGVLIPVTLLDHKLADALSALIGRDTGLILTGGVMVLIYAYLIRFMAISLQTIDAGFNKITPSMDDAARSLGLKNRHIVARVHAPLLKTSLITAGLMVFVDVMKELPATLVMRPFNFDTLAVRTYIFAKDERLSEAAVAALAIVLVGLIPVVLASKAITRENDRTV